MCTCISTCKYGEIFGFVLFHVQTNVKNNNNKFYIIQLLEDNDSRNFSVWFHWGRGEYVVGVSLCMGIMYSVHLQYIFVGCAYVFAINKHSSS